MIDMATVAVIALPSFAMGAFLAHTFLPAKGEGNPNVCDDACTIERLTEEVASWKAYATDLTAAWKELRADYDMLSDEIDDLHIDIEAKRKRLSDAGLQSAGGCDE